MDDKATTEYYFSDNNLIYIHETENYNPEVYMDSEGTVEYKAKGPDFEGQYYFHNEKMVNSKIKGQPRILPDEKFFLSQSKEGQLKHSAQKYTNLLINNKK